jgi:hypothetical protein
LVSLTNKYLATLRVSRSLGATAIIFIPAQIYIQNQI